MRLQYCLCFKTHLLQPTFKASYLSFKRFKSSRNNFSRKPWLIIYPLNHYLSNFVTCYLLQLKSKALFWFSTNHNLKNVLSLLITNHVLRKFFFPLFISYITKKVRSLLITNHVLRKVFCPLFISYVTQKSPLCTYH